VNTNGSFNVANGSQALFNNTNGSFNTSIGYAALLNNTSGSNNIALGSLAGDNITTGSFNIDIGNGGVATDTSIIRIGLGQTQTFIAGVINGSGAGLTSLNAANLTGTVPSASLTSVPATNLTGTIPLAQLPSAVVTNNASGVTLRGLTVNGITSLSGNLVMNDKDIQLRSTYDHGIGWYGSGKPFAGVSVDGPVVYGYGGGGLGIVHSGSTSNIVVYWNSSGNVGIGTTTPGHALDVSGDINASGTFTGNGGGLTNVTAAALATPQGMALIPAGLFTMGNSIGDGDITDANPTNITVSAFYMDINLVSYAQWQSVYFWATSHGYSFDYAGSGKAANHPVQSVDWYDVVKWSNARSVQAGLTPVYYTDAGFTQIYTTGEVSPYMNMSANGYRLPTEAEWEKAARGGLSGQRFPWGNVITENLANYYGNTATNYDLGPNGYNTAFTNGAATYTSPAGYFAPNGYGLYDMAGNVYEWCWDWYGTPYGQPTNTNPTGPATGSGRVLRGGYWGSYVNVARCAFRFGSNPVGAGGSIGFRCVRGH
jgi:formylglycine-generating enzyme required for sulfatase activity